MRHFRRILFVLLTPSLSGLVARAQVADVSANTTAGTQITRLPVRSDSRLWLEGSSNVRNWTCVAKTIDATLGVETTEGGSSPTAHSVRAVSVKVPVRTLKCGDRHMEANMYRALKAPPPPATSFIIAEFSDVPAEVNERGTAVTGRMTVAGVERAVRMTVRMDELPDGTRKAIGSVPIRMTDFDITPPRPWMGLLRAANEVVVRFEIYVSPPTVTARVTRETGAAGEGK